MFKSLVIFLGVTILFEAGPDASLQGERATVDFHLKANLIIVEAKINGVKKEFILDTGASRTTISSSLVDELGIEVVEKLKARGVGGEVDASIVRVDSLSIGNITLNDFSCGVVYMKKVGRVMGGDVSGVLGYDFLSQFKITIDYQNKQLVLERYPREDKEAYIITGNCFLSTKFGIEITRPDQSWQFVTTTPLPDIPVIIEKENSSGSVRVHVQELQGLTLDNVIPMIESALTVRVESYKPISSKREKSAAGEYHLYEYTGKKDGEERHFKHVVFKNEAFLYNIYCSAIPAEFSGLLDAFDLMIKSIRFP